MACRGKSWCLCRACRMAGPSVSLANRTDVLKNMRTVMRDPRQRYQRIKYLKSQNRGLTTWPNSGTLALENGKGGEGGRHVHDFDRTLRLIGQMRTMSRRPIGKCPCANPSYPHRSCTADGGGVGHTSAIRTGTSSGRNGVTSAARRGIRWPGARVTTDRQLDNS